MTQTSFPQQDRFSSTYPDSGPYSCDEWASLFNALFVGPNSSTQGPFNKSTLNELAVTNPAGQTMRVDSGEGLVNGRWMKNDATLDFTAVIPTSNPRMDVVCMVENNTNAAVTSSDWMFPGTLTDYDNLSSIPAYTARLVIVRGLELAFPVPPTLTQSTTLFMTPIAQYQISVAGAISNLFSRRDWANFPMATKQRISEQVLLSATQTPSFSGIPQYYRHLEIQFMGGNNAVAGTTDHVRIFFNSDLTANYYYSWTAVDDTPATTRGGGGVTTTTNDPQSFYNISDTDGVSQAHITIPYYAYDSMEKVAHAQYSYALMDGVADTNLSGRAATFWDSTAAITSISLSSGGQSFNTGSVFSLYGVL